PFIVLVLVALAALAAGIFLTTGNGVAGSGKKAAETTAQAQPDAAPGGPESIKLGNPTVAVINGEEVKRSDVFEFIGTLPDQIKQLPIQNVFPLALEQVVNNKII